MLLCSTSWQSDLEFEAIEKSRLLGIPSVAFLDHWVSYRERFSRNGRYSLPDQIWVGDAVAKKIASKTFLNCPVFLEDNPYFLDIIEELPNLKPGVNVKGLSVLYVCEPISVHAKLRYGDERYWGYVEEDALRYFLSNISVLRGKVKSVRIRPHPSENPKKYDWAIKETALPIEISEEETLLSDISKSNVIVGCESMAMVIGLLARKRVISCIPPGGRECVLPHLGVEKLQKLISDFR